jgi:hypothetical protein
MTHHIIVNTQRNREPFSHLFTQKWEETNVITVIAKHSRKTPSHPSNVHAASTTTPNQLVPLPPHLHLPNQELLPLNQVLSPLPMLPRSLLLPTNHLLGVISMLAHQPYVSLTLFTGGREESGEESGESAGSGQGEWGGGRVGESGEWREERGGGGRRKKRKEKGN